MVVEKKRKGELRSGESGHGSPPGVGSGRRRRRCGVVGENERGERGTREGRVDLRGYASPHATPNTT